MTGDNVFGETGRHRHGLHNGTEGQRRRVALVTGASRGLGEAFVETLAVHGYHVIATARTGGALEELASRVNRPGQQATTFAADITSDTDMQRLCRSIHDTWNGLDLFVHAAIHAPSLSPVAFSDLDEVRRAVEVNCLATWRLITFVAPLLKLAGSATAVFFEDDRAGEKFFGGYGSSKAFQISMVRSWQKEIPGGSDLRIEILKPRPMATVLRRRFHPGEDRSRLATPQSEAVRLFKLLMGTGGFPAQGCAEEA